MSNEYYDHGSYPATGSSLSSASMRAELESIETGFDKLPTLTGNANELVVVNPSGTALTTIPAGESSASTIHAATSKATPVDADEIPLSDSEASWGLKKLTWANLKAGIKSYYDSVTATLSNKTLADPVYTGTLTGGTGVVNLGSGQFYKAADGKVGFGTTTPYATVDAIDTMRINASANGNDAVFTLRSGSTAGTTQQILFSKAGSAGDVRIIGDNENNALRIVTAGGTVGTFDSAGNLLVGPTSNTLSKVNAYATGGGGPASTPSNASMTLGASSTSGVLSAGVDASSGFYSWIQSRSGSAGETYYDLAIQPRGGNLLVGTSTSEGGKFQIRCSTGDYVRISDGSYGALIGSAITLTGSGATADVAFRVVNELVFARSGGAISGKFDSSGNLLVGTTSGSFHVLQKSNASNYAAAIYNPSATNPYGLFVSLNGVTGGAGNNILECADSGGTRFKVLGSGNCQNVNNSYGAISDLKLKDDITDASPKLAKLMQVRIVNYTLKADPDKTKLIGVIAQELEQISPGLIEETPDFEEVTKTREVEVPEVPAVLDDEGNEVTPAIPASTKTEEYTERVPLGTVTKSVKYSVFVPMLIKGMQEQQAHIEAMQAQLDAQNEAMQLLAARLAALEAK